MENEEIIQAYVHDSLSETEKAAFEKEMSLNSALQIAVADYRNIHVSIQQAERESLKKRLQELKNSETVEEQKSVVRRLRPYLLPLAAASVLFIALLGKDFLFSSSNTELYNDYYSSYPNTLQPVTRATGDVNKETTAFVTYEAGDYKKAATLFEEILKTKTDPDIKFYYSMSLLNSGKDKTALALLHELKRDSTLYIPQTYWYAALLELKNGNKQRSKELIDSLQLLNADFKTEAAKELEKRLD